MQAGSATPKTIRLPVAGSCLVVQFLGLPRNKIVSLVQQWVKPIAPISICCNSDATSAKVYSQMYNGKSRHMGVKHSMI
ncbi:hypothetical protein Tco_0584722, partial [Tanacetum coccineum]